MGLGKIKSKIDNLAKKYDLTNQSLWDMFFFENFLNRLSKSKYSDLFVFKGGFYLGTIVGIGQRTTLDIDLKYMGYSLPDDTLLNIFNKICELKLDDDLIYEIIDIKIINNNGKNVGKSIRISASYFNIKKVFCIDIGVGDVITPCPLKFTYTSSINDLTFNLLAYSKETILAEKIQTLIVKGFNNSRIKDLFDLYLLFKEGYDKDLLISALINTFFARSTMFNNEIYNDVELILSTSRIKEKFDDYVVKNKFTKGLQYDECKNVILNIIYNIEFTKKIEFNNVTIDILRCDEDNQNLKINIFNDRIDIIEHESICNNGYDIVILSSDIYVKNFNNKAILEKVFNIITENENHIEYYNQLLNSLIKIEQNKTIITIIYCLFNGWVYSEYVNLQIPKYSLLKLN